jgi:hypothetical protein
MEVSMNGSYKFEDLNNPLNDLISDEIYKLLSSRGFINQNAARDHFIRKRFRYLRASRISAGDAIDELRKDYPYLQFETIRQIVYNPAR